ncbi:MAG: class I SAM-dependent methyltransferase [Acidimicrobiales bacterium]
MEGATDDDRRRVSSRWSSSHGARGEDYDARFEQLATTGLDVHGEASLVASLDVECILDAGCGTGRVAIELARRGLEVVGVDLDPSMLEVARQKGPAITWMEASLADVDLGRSFDAVVMAGNVMIFVDPGTEGPVLANMARHLRPGGLLIAGFSLLPDRLGLSEYDRLAGRVGLILAERFSTWDRLPFEAGSDYAVSIHRRGPAPPER